MRGTSLLNILDQLRAEARMSQHPGHNRQVRDSHVNLIQRTQERLWDDFAWPHLRVQRQRPVSNGQRYYAPPPDIKVDNIERIEVFDGGQWKPLLPGIYGEHYAQFNSDLDQRSWPVRRWQIYEGEQIEIWPIGNANGTTKDMEGMLRFVGIRNLKPFVKDNDRADLDDRLIVMFGAAELLAAQGAKDAQLKLDQAQSIYRRLRAGLTARRRFRMFGIGSDPAPQREFVTRYTPPVKV